MSRRRGVAGGDKRTKKLKERRERKKSMTTFSSYAAQLRDIIQYRNEMMNFRAH